MTRTDSGKWVRAAVVQAGAVPFESDACVDKAVQLIQEASATGAKVIVFPKALIGGYPKGLHYDPVVGARDPAGREEFRGRPDIFQLIVNEAPTPAVVTKTGE